MTALDEVGARRFRRYWEYKNSGVEWLGEIPASWSVKRLKYLCSRSAVYGANEPSASYSDEGVRFLRTTDITEAGHLVHDGAVFVDRDVVADYLLNDGDLLLSRSGTLGRSLHYQRALHGECAYAGYLVRFVPTNELNTQFAFYFTKTEQFQQWLNIVAIQSTIGNINGQKYAGLALPVPPIQEQAAIATFLDSETAKIDALVAKRERLIELLEEKRVALITWAVTNGLDPNVPMKDSGAEWLGEIPAHWEVKKLKAVSSLQTGVALGKKYDSTALEARPYLRVANVQDGYLDLEEVTQIDLPSRDIPRYELRSGDVVVTEGGDFDKLGRGYVWEGQISGCLHQNHIFAIRPDRTRLHSQFLTAVMSSLYGRAYFTATSKQSTNLASTNSSKIRQFQVPLPKFEEQGNILHFIADQTERIDGLLRGIELSIDRLQELRSALISAAVTGQIDVREEVA